MGRDPDVSVSDSFVDLLTRTKIDMDTNLDVEADSVLVAESIMDVSIEIETMLRVKPVK